MAKFTEMISSIFPKEKPLVLEGGVSFNADDELNRINNMQGQDRINAINWYYDKQRENDYNEYINNIAKLYGGAALEIGSAFIPMSAGARLAGGAATKIAPFVGKKIAQELATGTIGGALSGAVGGFGQGLMEDKNPLVTSLQRTALEGLGGGALSGFGGLTVKQIAKNKINPLKGKSKLTLEEKKLINNYYSDYERGVNTINKSKDIGKIELPSQAMKETIKQQPQKAAEVIDLSKSLKNATLTDIVSEWHKNKYNSDIFYHLTKDSNEYILAHNPKNGKKYFHIIKRSKPN